MSEKLVLIPGLNNTAETWAGVEEYLPYKLEAYSMDVPALPEMRAIVNKLLSELPEKFYLCGFSFGGHVALEMLAVAPERILGIALMGSLTNADSEAQKEARTKSINRAESGEYFEMTEANAHKTFHPDSMKNESVLKLRDKIVQDYGVVNYIAHVKAMISRKDNTDVLRKSTIPKLFIAGEGDKVILAEKIKETASKMSNVEYTVIPKAGHMMPLEQPKLSAEVLSSWIQKINDY